MGHPAFLRVRSKNTFTDDVRQCFPMSQKRDMGHPAFVRALGWMTQKTRHEWGSPVVHMQAKRKSRSFAPLTPLHGAPSLRRSG